MMSGAVKEGYIEVNPCSKVKNLEVKQQIERLPIYNMDELFKVIWSDQELRDYCLLMYYTILRSGDVVNLQYDNIKEKGGIKYFEVIEGKTNHRVQIPVHNALIQNGIIVEGGSGYILKYSLSRPFAVEHLGRKFKEALKNNKLSTDITPYWIRHTAIDALESLGVEESTIRHLLGKKLAGSLNSYSHSNLERMKTAIDRLPNYNFFTQSSPTEILTASGS